MGGLFWVLKEDFMEFASIMKKYEYPMCNMVGKNCNGHRKRKKLEVRCAIWPEKAVMGNGKEKSMNIRCAIWPEKTVMGIGKEKMGISDAMV